MSVDSSRLRDALRDKSLTDLTKALGGLADRIDYRLKPPLTEVERLTSREEDGRYSIQFEGQLSLHYASAERQDEGLLFNVKFSGSAIADAPTPPIDELLYAAMIQSVSSFGYGARWKGETIPTPQKFSDNLEVTAKTISKLEISDLFNL
jgi:hypothetical protein